MNSRGGEPGRHSSATKRQAPPQSEHSQNIARPGSCRYPGTEQGSLVEGELTLMVQAQPDAVFKPGQSWMIPAGTPHDAKAGPGGAKVIAVYTVEKGKPLASPAN